jgi:hypothetical protein
MPVTARQNRQMDTNTDPTRFPAEPQETIASMQDEPGLPSEVAFDDEPGPTPEEIAARAYSLYEARGGQDGYDVEDWLEAERDLRSTRRLRQ